MKSFFKKYYHFMIAGVFTLAILAVAFISGGNIQQAKNAVESKPAEYYHEQITDFSSTVPASTVVSSTANEAQTTESTASTKATESVPTTAPVTTSSTVPSTTVKPKTTQPAAVSTQPATQKPTQSTTAPRQTVSKTGESKKTSSQPAIDPTTKPKAQTTTKPKNDPVKTTVPTPTKSQEKKDKALHCTISISCGTVLNNMDKLDDDLLDIIPSDGKILSEVSVEFKSGESVFDVLKRVCADKKIHMEFSYNSVYDSAYIEGINNLYEFDCGANSGWMYKVNGWVPNYGCSKYSLKDGDVIEWVYTCNLGYDVGGGKVN